jgi:hypothetical protein
MRQTGPVECEKVFKHGAIYVEHADQARRGLVFKLNHDLETVTRNSAHAALVLPQ